MIKVLFLCTGNSCRSIMAEAILRAHGGEKLAGHSAGSRPAGFIHPLAIHALTAMRIPLGNLESKSWDVFAGQAMDVVITLCDSAATEPCPTFAETKFRAHWSLPDPAFHPGSEEERARFALNVAGRIRSKIEGLIGIDWSESPEKIKKRLDFLGEI